MNFVAIDVETANADMASICQIGIAKYENGMLVGEWVSYVDPKDYFDGINVHIHGIDEETIKGAPTFKEIFHVLQKHLDGQVVVSHTHFDRVAIHQAVHKHNINSLDCVWLDSARVARRAWSECAYKGYGLYALCKKLGHDFKHHDALADAIASGFIMLAASKECGFGINEWLKRVEQPIDPSNRDIERDGNPEGELFGEILVFTGTLLIPRREAADLAASIGCQVASSVTKKKTLLVVGDQDIKRLAGHEKSSKHRKAEELINKGVPIRILKESDFKELARISK